MLSVFCAPSRYVQGPGATGAIAREMKTVGLEGPVLIIASSRIEAMLRSAWEESFSAESFAFGVQRFGGECSPSEIQRGKEAARALGAKAIVGAGGGKVLDTARAVASDLGLPIVDAPTVASSDSPCSALSVVYTDEGEFDEYRIYGRNPDLVLVDTLVIAKSPARLLVAGMGDALATRFEAEACARSGAKNMRGGGSTLSALALARLCYETLLVHGPGALAALERGEPDASLESLVEANTLLSGLGFESSGLAAAHAIHNGLTTAAASHKFLHGEKVGFGLIAQLALEHTPDRIMDEVLDFSRRVGLPITLAQVGLGDAEPDVIRRVAERASAPDETVHNEPFSVTSDDVARAILEADAAGRAYFDKRNCQDERD
jgi:glycerol dehydrogenase